MAVKQEDVVLAFKLYNLAMQALLRALESSGSTLDEVRASVDAEEGKFFDQNQRRIDELKARQ